MKICITILCFLLVSTGLAGQSMSSIKLQNVKVTIGLVRYKVPTSDSIVIVVNLLNETSKLQRLLFEKPFARAYPWETSFSVIDDSGKSVLTESNKNLLSSQIYSENQLQTLNAFTILKPGESVSHAYYLKTVVVFRANSQQLGAGEYSLAVTYGVNRSNEVQFAIE